MYNLQIFIASIARQPGLMLATSLLLMLVVLGLIQLRRIYGLRSRAAVEARARGVSLDHYLAMLGGLVQDGTGIADPLPRALLSRALHDPGYREALIERATLLPIRRFWRQPSPSHTTIVPPEVVLAQLCRRHLETPLGHNHEMSTQLALAWQLANLTSDAPTLEQVQRIVWDRRYRAEVLAAVDTPRRPRPPQPSTVGRAC
jgi:hypothetical protein